MGNFLMNSQGTGTYLEYELDEEEKIDTLVLGMLANNQIPGVIPVTFYQMNEKKYIKYNVSSKISLKKVFVGEVNRVKLLTIFKTMIEAILELEEYMIPIDNCLLEEERIFVDTSGGRANVICMPILEIKQDVMLCDFLKNILFYANYDSREDTSYVAKLISLLNKKEAFSLMELKKEVESLLQGNQTGQQTVQGTMQTTAQQAGQQATQGTLQAVAPQTAQGTAQTAVQQTTQGTVRGTSRQTAQGTVRGTARQTAQVNTQQTVQQTAQASTMQPNDNLSMNIPMSQTGENQTVQAEGTVGGKTEKGGLLRGLFKKKTENVDGTNANGQQFDFLMPGQEVAMPGTMNVSTTMNEPVAIPDSNTVAGYNSLNQQPINVVNPGINTNLQQQTDMSADFGETTVIEQIDYNATTVLQQPEVLPSDYPYLIRKKTKEKIVLNKDIFCIGRENQYADYCIRDNKAVGHNHADILKKEDGYVILDNNTLNGTKLDGRKINSSVEEYLKDGMEICLANEVFEFHSH